jgi:hypothetical protein
MLQDIIILLLLTYFNIGEKLVTQVQRDIVCITAVNINSKIRMVAMILIPVLLKKFHKNVVISQFMFSW